MTRPSGFLRKNPVAVALVGLCPAAAVTGRVIDALWMSLGLVFVLVLTRVSQAILHGLNSTGEPPSSKAPATKGWLGCLFLASCFTASFELILQAFAPDESASLGIYVSLLAVNCIVLDRLGSTAGMARQEGPAAKSCGRCKAQRQSEQGSPFPWWQSPSFGKSSGRERSRFSPSALSGEPSSSGTSHSRRRARSSMPAARFSAWATWRGPRVSSVGGEACGE